jgi:hypothetical protein
LKKMKKKYTLIISIMMLMTLVPTLTINPVAAEPEQITIFCGSIYIEKVGDGPDNVIVEVTPINNDIEIPFQGADVTFVVEYHMINIYGISDCAYVKANNQADECDGDSKSSHFYFYKSFDNNGGSFTIDLWGQYKDWIGWPPPLPYQVTDSGSSFNTFTWHCPVNHPPTVSRPCGDTHVEIGHGVNPNYDPVEFRTYSSRICDQDGNLMRWNFNYGNGEGIDGNGIVRTDVGWSAVGTYYVTCTVTDIPEYPAYQQTYTVTSDELTVHVEYWYNGSNAHSYALSMPLIPGGAEAFVEMLPASFDIENAAAYGFYLDNFYEDGIYDTFYCLRLEDQSEIINVQESFPVSYNPLFNIYTIDADTDFVNDAVIPAGTIETCNENPWESQGE